MKEIRNNILLLLLTFCVIAYKIADTPKPNVIHQIPPQEAIFNGEIQQVLSRSEKNLRLLAFGNVEMAIGKVADVGVVLDIRHARVIKDLKLGAPIFANCKVRKPKPKLFDWSFNEIEYLYGLDATYFASANMQNVSVTAECKESWNDVIKNTLLCHIEKYFSSNVADFVKATLLADRVNLDKQLENEFAVTGIAHILSISGLHIGLLASVLWLLLSYLSFGSYTFNSYLRFVIFTFLLSVFIFLIGMPASAVRAGIMAVLFLLGKTLQRKVSFLRVILFVILLTSLFFDRMLFSVSFQLSIISVISIYIFYNPIRNNIIRVFKVEGRVSTYLINSLALSLSVSILLNPVLAYYFDMVSLVSPFANVVLIPLFSLILLFSIITLAFSFVLPSLASIFAGSVEILYNICLTINKFFAEFNNAAITHSNHTMFIAFVLSAAILLFCTAKNKKQIFFRISYLSVVAVLCFMLLQSPNNTFQKYDTACWQLVIMPLNDNESIVWLIGKPYKTYYNDSELKEYFLKNDVKRLYVSGEYGEEFGEANKYSFGLDVKKLSIEEQKLFAALYDGQENQ